jgi:hypothetical protein
MIFVAIVLQRSRRDGSSLYTSGEHQTRATPVVMAEVDPFLSSRPDRDER